MKSTEILFLESIPFQQNSSHARHTGSMHLGQAAGKVNVCSVCSSNILTSITNEFARENLVVHIAVIEVASGANSNHFLGLQLGEISNTKKQFLRVCLLVEEP